MLIGILILSIGMMEKNRSEFSALLISTLINFKHLFIVVTPVFFFYLLRKFCLSSNFRKFF